MKKMMKRAVSILLAAVLLLSSASAVEFLYVDSIWGPKDESASGLGLFREGTLPDYRYGLSDFSGNIVLPAEYEWLNRAGDLIIAGEPTARDPYGMGYKIEATVYRIFDFSGTLLATIEADYVEKYAEGVYFTKEGIRTVYDPDLRILATLDSKACGYLRGCVIVMQESGSGYKYGLVAVDGTELLPAEYDQIDVKLEEGTIRCRTRNGSLQFQPVGGQSFEMGLYDQEYYRPEDLLRQAGVKLHAGEVYGAKPVTPTGPVAYATSQMIAIDGEGYFFDTYALKDKNGNMTNYVRVRELGRLLCGSKAEFEVSWDGAVNLLPGKSFTPTADDRYTPFSGNRPYQTSAAATKVNGKTVQVDAITLTDDNGGGYTYYKLRDLGKLLGFNVGWSAGGGVYIESDKPYVG